MWELVLKLLAVVVAGAAGANTRDVTDAQYAQFPRLFHLDDYEECMLRKDGVYCLGTFDVTAQGANPTYDLMKFYSEDIHNFNRTRLHRGYCLSTRCSSHHLLPPAERFERCVAKWGLRQGLTLKLRTLNYCHTYEDHKQRQEWKLETSHYVFLAVVGGVLLMNTVGTLYDLLVDDSKKWKPLQAWSVFNSWKYLIGPNSADDPKQAATVPVEGARVILMFLVIFTHAGCIHDMLYLQNPKFIEQMSHHPIMMLLQNGSSCIQIFFLLSCFLLANSLLKQEKVTFKLVFKILIKRIVRIAPVYMLMVGYAATWWPLARNGPQWTPLVVSESNVCRNKLWFMIFFLGNFVKDDERCLLQTWFLSVDMQLYVMSAILTLLLVRVRRHALIILGGLFFITCVINTVMAYIYEWVPLMHISGPENVRNLYADVPSFREFYSRPLGSATTSLAGIFMAFLYRELQHRKFNPKDHKGLITMCQWCLPLLPAYTMGAGNLLREVNSRWARALCLALERPVMCLLATVLLFGFYQPTSIDKRKSPVASTKGYLQQFFAWRGWYPMGRMSLAVLMLHWCLNMLFAASRRNLYYSSTLDMFVDFVACTGMSYIVAIPITLLVDIPMQKFYSALVS